MNRLRFIALISLSVVLNCHAEKRPRNVIFMIADGMGVSQLYAAMSQGAEKMNIERFNVIGLSRTGSADRFVTDTGAGVTAISSAAKTRNGQVGMSVDSLPLKSLLSSVHSKKMSTGLIATCAVTGSGLSPFYAHQLDKDNAEGIALDFLNSDIDVLIGGGRKYFEAREDSLNVSEKLIQKGYQVVHSLDAQLKSPCTKLVALLYDDQVPSLAERANMLSDALNVGIKVLKDNRKGFVLVVNAAQIDWACHDNNANALVGEIKDFDKALGVALDFARKEKNTLVIVASPHETGGLILTNSKTDPTQFQPVFMSKLHTGTPVPVFAYGPGAENFSGFMDNTDFRKKILTLLGVND